MKYKTIINYLRDFENNVRCHEMKGASPPEEWEEIERRYKETKIRLEKALKRMSNGL